MIFKESPVHNQKLEDKFLNLLLDLYLINRLLKKVFRVSVSMYISFLTSQLSLYRTNLGTYILNVQFYLYVTSGAQC